MTKTKGKTFDCVEMKRTIQAKHLEEYAGMTDEDIGRHIQQKLATSANPVAVWYRNAMASKAQTAKH